MGTQVETTAAPRIPLTRQRVLSGAIVLADQEGLEALSMRRLGQELGVEAMSLYNHVANKEDILDGMVDAIVGEIDLSNGGTDWKSSMRRRALAAREVMVRHDWASGVIESRTNISPAMMTYMESTLGIFVDGGFSMDLAHHAMHAIGSRLLGFTQSLFDEQADSPASPEEAAILAQQMTAEFPNISALVMEITHDEDSTVGEGCDDDVEFVFALDLILDGLDRLKESA